MTVTLPKIPPGLLPSAPINRMPQGLSEGGGVVPPVSSVKWSEIIINSNIVLSSGDLVATAGAGLAYQGGAATGTVTVGQKRYWLGRLITLAGPGTTAMGIANASNTYNTGQYLGITNNAIGFFDDGTVIRNNATIATLTTPVAGDYVNMAVDGQNKLWLGVNGVYSGNPAAGTGGIDISTLGDVLPAYSVVGFGGPTVIEGIFGGSLPFAAPVGFSIFP